MSEISDTVRGSMALVIACKGDDTPDETCEAVGRAVMMGKPIILVVVSGVQVPPKLALLVDCFVEWVADPCALGAALKSALTDLGLLKGGQCQCHDCKEKANSNITWQDRGFSQN